MPIAQCYFCESALPSLHNAAHEWADGHNEATCCRFYVDQLFSVWMDCSHCRLGSQCQEVDRLIDCTLPSNVHAFEVWFHDANYCNTRSGQSGLKQMSCLMTFACNTIIIVGGVHIPFRDTSKENSIVVVVKSIYIPIGVMTGLVILKPFSCWTM